MINFSHRSRRKEFLDSKLIPFEDIAQNMRELEFINTHLGGHAITINGFKQLLGDRKTISICEIGCGGGDNLMTIGRYCKRNKITVTLVGIDNNAECIEYAKKRDSTADIDFLVSDYKLAGWENHPPDIIFSSLFCHHFTDEELVEMLSWMKHNSALGFFINDLHRHPLAYFFIKYATKLFSKSYLVKHDAPLSVARGFTKREWRNIFERARIGNYSIQWKWAFRYLITALNAQGTWQNCPDND